MKGGKFASPFVKGERGGFNTLSQDGRGRGEGELTEGMASMNAEQRRKRWHDEAMKLMAEARNALDRGMAAEAASIYETALQTEELAAKGDSENKAFYCKCAAMIAYTLGDAELVEQYCFMATQAGADPKTAAELAALKMRMIHEDWELSREAVNA